MVFALLGLQFVHQFRGEHAAAHVHARELLELSKEHGIKLHEAIAMLAVGEAFVGQRQLDAGIRWLRDGWEAYRATGADLGITYWQVQLLEAYIAAGQWPAAWELVEQASRDILRLDEHLWEAELYRLRGELLLQQAADATGTASASSADHYTAAE